LPQLPFLAGTAAHTTRYFLNTSPIHAGGTTGKDWERISAGEFTCYMDAHHSARGFCRILMLLLQAVKVDPASIKIRLH
jgi:hypothetical protein